MSAVLKFPQLAQNDGVAEVNVRSSRVDPEFHPERTPLRELPPKRPLWEGVHGVSEQEIRVVAHEGNGMLARSTDGPFGLPPLVVRTPL